MNKFKKNALTAILLVLLITLSISLQAIAAVSRIQTEDTIGIQNDLFSIEFDKNTGQLLSLKNLATDDQYLKRAKTDGNPFRAYLNTTRFPDAVAKKYGYKQYPPVEDDMGGEIIDPQNCKLTDSSFSTKKGVGVLSMTLISPERSLSFLLTIKLSKNSTWSDWSLKATNISKTEQKLLTAFPYFTGLQLGKDSADDLGVDFNKQVGVTGLTAWRNMGGVYGEKWTSQINAVYQSNSPQAFGYIVKDAKIESKTFHRFPDGGMSTLCFTAKQLKPNQQIQYPSISVCINQGGWEPIARQYGKWFEKNIGIRKSPEWFLETQAYWGRWVPSLESVQEAKQKQDGPGVFASYKNLPRLYLNGHHDLMEWAMYANGIMTLKDDSLGGMGPDGMNVARSDLGGVVALREGIEKLHKVGRRATLYVAGYSVMKQSDLFNGVNVEDWMLMTEPGKHWVIDVKDGIQICPGYKPWQEHLAQMCKRLIWETGADGVRLDQYAHYTPCYNPAHKHENPYNSNKWILEILQKIRTAMDEVNPQAILWAECLGGDFMHKYVDGILFMGAHYPGRDIAPLRVVLPTLSGLGYDFGSVEAALNGIGSENFRTCRRSGWESYHIENKEPENYPKLDDPYEIWWGPGAGRSVRWHELRPTFVDVWKNPLTADQDPIAPDRPQWWGRLWKSEKYWLITGSIDNGSETNKPIRVKMNDLPKEIKQAYEIDTVTLKVRDANLQRTENGVFVTLNHGFSAVLLPKKNCPPLVKMNRPAVLKPGMPEKIELGLFAPWKTSKPKAKVTVEMPGLMSPVELKLPATVTVNAPKDAEPGYYKFTVKGQCLPLRRWLVNDFVPDYIPFDDTQKSKSKNRSDDYLPQVVEEWKNIN